MQTLSFITRAAAGVACVLGAIALVKGADDPPETYRQIIARRQAPQLEGLARRASPDQQGEMATESFWDLLKLRDQPVAAAEGAAELVKILAAHEDSTRIHRFAAAQALFAIGDHDATRALEKHLLSPLYPAHLAVTYSSHWEMAEPQRSQFIEKYLLRDLADDLGVSVHARWSDGEAAKGAARAADKDNGKKLLVKVTLVNASQRVLAVLVEHQYQTMALHLRGPSGMFVPQSHLVVYGPDPGRFVRLRPGESTSFDVALEMKAYDATLAKTHKFMRNAGAIKAFLKSPDTGFALSEFGRYELSAMIVRMPLVDEQKKSIRERQGIDPSEVWTGRAVSKPVEVEFHNPHLAVE
jgi:hypothetical protein